MATYDSLTADEKDDIQYVTNQIRAHYGSLARFLVVLDGIRIDALARGYIGLINGLDASEVVPNTSGLGGSEDLTKEDLQQAVSDMNNLLITYNTDERRQVYSLMAGSVNTQPLP